MKQSFVIILLLPFLLWYKAEILRLVRQGRIIHEAGEVEASGPGPQ